MKGMRIKREEFEKFREWVTTTYGFEVSDNTNEFEIIRWRIPEKPMAICYTNTKNDLVTLNRAALDLYEIFKWGGRTFGD